MSQTDYNNLTAIIYNPGNQTKEELINNFVIRINEFNSIFEEIKSNNMRNPCQHFIIQGLRGSGKTSLLLRLYYEIKDDKSLNTWLIPIKFNEEQYSVRTLYKLWENIAARLEDECEIFNGLYDEMEKYIEEKDYEEICYELLKKALNKNRKKIVLLIDNFGEMLEKFNEKEHQRLREVLITSSDIRIIGASSLFLEFTYDYSKPFFDFFKVIHLGGLSKSETETLLLKLGENYNRNEIKEIIKKNPGRVEALRIITGGIPRTIILLFEIFIEDANGDSFKDLEILIDRVTPLYKHRMDDLPANQQEIVDIIAMNWDAINTKEIAKKSRMESKAVSAQLNLLEKNKIIIKRQTKTKNHLYMLNERFFNIWYLMRNGRNKDKNKVLWLVRFLECWYGRKELYKRAEDHLNAIKNGQMCDKYAFYLTQAFAQLELPMEMQDNLIRETRYYLKKIGSDLASELSKSDTELFEEAEDYYKKKEYDMALTKLLEINYKDPVVYHNIGLLYSYKKDFKEEEKYYLKAAEKGFKKSIYSLAVLYLKLNYYEKAEKYFLLAADADKNDYYPLYGLLMIYYIFLRKKEYIKSAIKLFEKENNFINSLFYSIALLWENNSENAINLIKTFLNIQTINYNTIDELWIKKLLKLLIAKKQYNFTFQLFSNTEPELKDRYRPIYYALMFHMQNKYPDEYLKMGTELKETVEEIIKEIEQMAIDYQ